MKSRPHRALSLLLILILLTLAAFPAAVPLSAQAAVDHPADDTLLLLVYAELWATGGGAPIEAGLRAPGPLKIATRPAKSARQTENAINAVKEVIAMKEAAYQQSSSMLAGKISTETLQDYESIHQDQIQTLITMLEELRREWRRQKRLLPKLTKPFKQAGAWAWHKIGPAGRSILRAFGNELLQSIVAGNPISGQVVRMLLIKHIRAYGEKKGREMVQRILLGRLGRSQEDQPEAAGKETALEEKELDWESFWSATYDDLVAQRLHCNGDLVGYYQQCLQAATESEETWAKVLNACESFPTNLLPYPAGHVVLEDTSFQFRDDDNYLRLEYDTNSDQVAGVMNVVFKDYGSGAIGDDQPYCTLTRVTLFEGTFDEDNCSMSGTGTSELSWEGDEDVCAWTEMQVKENPAPITFEATVVRGTINGGAVLPFILDFAEHQIPAE